MTTKELIELLSRYPPDTAVTVAAYDYTGGSSEVLEDELLLLDWDGSPIIVRAWDASAVRREWGIEEAQP